MPSPQIHNWNLLGVPLTRLVQDGISAAIFQASSAAVYLLGLGLIHKLYTLGFLAGVCLVIVSTSIYIFIPNAEFPLKVSDAYCPSYDLIVL